MAAYVQAAEQGPPPDRQAWLARYPELAGGLAEFFADLDAVGRVAALRSGGPGRARDAATGATTLGLEERTLAPGTQVRYFGDYELLDEIARGGMGVVYKARQVSLNRVVALKMILAGQLASAGGRAALPHRGRGGRQASTTRTSCRSTRSASTTGQHYFSMKLIEGGSLARPAAAAAGSDPRRGGPAGGDGRPGGPSRPPARHPAPRPQAGQHPARRRGPAARHRLRPGQARRTATAALTQHRRRSSARPATWPPSRPRARTAR